MNLKKVFLWKNLLKMIIINSNIKCRKRIINNIVKMIRIKISKFRIEMIRIKMKIIINLIAKSQEYRELIN
jgi:hypothetical protein